MRPNRLAGLFAALLLAACDQPQAASNAAPPPVPEVGVYTVQAQSLTLTTDLPGRTAAFRVAKCGRKSAAFSRSACSPRAPRCRRGMQLYQIDPATYKAAYDKAAANLVTSKRRAERYEKLVKDLVIGRQEYDDAVAAWKEAEAEVEVGTHRSRPHQDAVADLRAHRPLDDHRRRAGHERPGPGARRRSSSSTRSMST